MSQVTFVITSCGRFDLLEQTLDSFLELNDFPIYEYIIHEDSGDPEMYDKIMEKYGHIAEIIASKHKKGLSKSIDTLYNCVETPYIFHCEDDWSFSGNRHFISESLAVLSGRPDIHQVWIRHEHDHKLPLGQPYPINGVLVRDVIEWKEWIGFSWNPGLRRVSDYKRMFPNGYSEFGDELLCNIHAKQYNYKAVSLVNTVAKHIGYGRHTKDFQV